MSTRVYPPIEYDDICVVCGTYCPEGGGIHHVCKEVVDAILTREKAKIPVSAIREVIRISDRDHIAWNAVKEWLHKELP